MKFKLKKLAALLVTSFIGVTSICPVFAAESETVSSVLVATEDCSEAKDEFMEDIDIVANLMEINLKRDGIDLSSATIGQPFLVSNSDVYVFPVIIDGNIERMIEMTKKDNGNNYFAISEFFSDNIDNLPNGTYKMVADEVFDVFAISDDESILVNKYKDEESITEPLMPLSNDELDVVDIKEEFVDLENIPMTIENVEANGNGRWLGVPIIKQSEETCWAACMSSILKHYGENVSLNDILNVTGKGNYTGDDRRADYREVMEYFDKYYGYSSTDFNQYALPFSKIKTEINAGRPIYQAIGFQVDGGHVVVIEGYQERGTARYNAISIMDPYSTRVVDCNYYDDNSFSYDRRDSHEGLYEIK